MDDAAERPWGGLKKGLLDLVVAAMIARVPESPSTPSEQLVTLMDEISRQWQP